MILSPRGNLELRRKHSKPVVARIMNQYAFQTISACPFCPKTGLSNITVIGTCDRYGFPVRLAMCNRTGIIFLLDRLALEDYNEFYKQGHYREVLDVFWDRQPLKKTGEEQLSTNAIKKAKETVNALHGLVKFPNQARMLDIGGSTGEVSIAFKDAFGVLPTVLDPAEQELDIARQQGLDTRLGSFETVEFAPDEKYDIVLLHQTIEHIYNLQNTMERIRGILEPGGLFIFDFLDFIDELDASGSVEAVSRLDHCHWIYLEMLEVFLSFVGFRALSTIRSRANFFLVVCESIETNPDVCIEDEIRLRLIRGFASRQVQFLSRPKIESFSITERFKQRLGIKVSPF